MANSGMQLCSRIAQLTATVALFAVVSVLPHTLWAQTPVAPSSATSSPVTSSSVTQLPIAPSTPQSIAQQAPALAAAASPASLSGVELGDLYMAQKHFQAAIEAYHQTPPNTASVWNKIGIANQQMFLMDEAKKSYETALKLDPKNPDSFNNLGSIYYSLNQYGVAERMYRKALKLNPHSALVYKNLGTDLLAEGKFKKGWECYQSALGMDSEIFERNNHLRIGEPTPTLKRGAMNYYLAKSYVRSGMTDRAVSYLRMAIDEGFTDRKKVLADKELASLHGLPEFERMIREQTMKQ